MLRASFLLVVATALAPIQCPSRPRPDTERDESPGDALYQLSERFAAQGNRAARDETLRYLIERYPSSRWAHQAHDELSSSGGADGGT